MTLSERELTRLWWAEWKELGRLDKEMKNYRAYRNRLITAKDKVLDDLEDFDNKEGQLWDPFGVPSDDNAMIDIHDFYQRLIFQITEEMEFVANRQQQARIMLADYDHQLFTQYGLDTAAFLEG